MSTILDIIIAFSLGGILLIIVLNANDIAGEQSSVLRGDMLVQQMLVSITQFLEGEFRNMGFGVHIDSASILGARDTAITFLSDVNRNGALDTVRYFLGPLHAFPGVQNDSVRPLYRMINSEPRYSVGTVTRFSLAYFSQGQVDTLIPPKPPGQPNWTIRRSGGVDVVPPPIDMRQIKIIQITLEVQNPYAIYRRPSEIRPGERDALYSSSLWRQTRLASQNLRR